MKNSDDFVMRDSRLASLNHCYSYIPFLIAITPISRTLSPPPPITNTPSRSEPENLGAVMCYSVIVDIEKVQRSYHHLLSRVH